MYNDATLRGLHVLQAVYGKTKFGRIAHMLELFAYGPDVMMSAVVRTAWMAAF